MFERTTMSQRLDYQKLSTAGLRALGSVALTGLAG